MPRIYACWIAMIAVIMFSSSSKGQTEVVWVGGSGNAWTTPQNWDHPSDPGSVQGYLPTGAADELAVIGNGGLAELSVDLGTLGNGNGPPGGLELSGASTFRVQPGGIFSTDASGGTVNGSVTVSGGAVLSIVGPSAGFSADSMDFGGGIYAPVITSGVSHTTMNVAGSLDLSGGTLNPQFSGFTPTAGNSWVLADAASINGTLAISQSPVGLPAGLGVGLSAVPGGANGEQLVMAIETFAQLTINADTGAATLSSPSGATVNITGYGISSPSGQLSPGGWNTLESQVGGGWDVAGTPSVNNLDETAGPIPPGNTTQDSLGLTGTSRGIGTIFTTQGFGVSPNVSFEYTTVSGELRQGLVEFTGMRAVNNLLLTVDPSTGMGMLTNSSATTIELEGYSVLSASGSLDPANWDSLDDQNVDNSGVGGVDGFIQEANTPVPPDANQLSELVPDTLTEERSLTLSPGESYGLGMLFDPTGAQDLQLEFLIDLGDALIGDFNGDGTVNIADYTVWRDNLGGSESVLANPGNDNGVVDAGDYTEWKNNFGATGGGGLVVLDGVVRYEAIISGAVEGSTAPVPEPSSLAGLLVLTGVMLGVGRATPSLRF